MKLHIDTNVFLRASREPPLLTQAAKRVLVDPFNERFVSMASVWEVQIKHARGKLPLPATADEICQEWMQPLVAKPLALEFRHFRKVYELPQNHRDPFDRIFIA